MELMGIVLGLILIGLLGVIVYVLSTFDPDKEIFMEGLRQIAEQKENKDV